MSVHFKSDGDFLRTTDRSATATANRCMIDSAGEVTVKVDADLFQLFKEDRAGYNFGIATNIVPRHRNIPRAAIAASEFNVTEGDAAACR